ncbi:MAG TPA: hypothetical protein VEQ65_13430 [Opitutus sp.]|nr:hypothetical protein [Opitutus sp.]
MPNALVPSATPVSNPPASTATSVYEWLLLLGFPPDVASACVSSQTRERALPQVRAA